MEIYPQTFHSRKVKTNALNYWLMIFTKGPDVIVLLAIRSATFSSYRGFLAELPRGTEFNLLVCNTGESRLY